MKEGDFVYVAYARQRSGNIVIIGVYSTREKAKRALQNVVLQAPEDFEDTFVGVFYLE